MLGTPLSCRVRESLAQKNGVGSDAREPASIRYEAAFTADPGANLIDQLAVVTPARSLRFLGHAQARDAWGCLRVAPCVADLRSSPNTARPTEARSNVQ